MTRKAGSPKAGNRVVGRPTTFGVSQCAHFDSRQNFYNARRGKKGSQTDMTTFLDDELFLFFAKFGWDDPMRCIPVVAEPSPEDVLARKAEADEAGNLANSPIASETDKERDQLVKHVRKLMSARFQGNYPENKQKKATVNKAPAADIEKLLLTYMAKPSLRQLYKVWAKSRPDLEAEVNRRLPEVRLEKNDPEYGRIGVWNAVASEWYGAISEEEKEETMQKAKGILIKETKEWKDQLAKPKSMEEAKRFMLASQAFLEDLMQFFADRCGGMAVMILAGSGEVMLSQGSCDIAGKPKVLYGDIAEENVLLEGFAQRIHTQACLVTETRWGVRLSSDEAAKTSTCAAGMEEDAGDSIQIPHVTEASPSPFYESTLPIASNQDGREVAEDVTSYEGTTTSFSAPHNDISLTPHEKDSIALTQSKDKDRILEQGDCPKGISAPTFDGSHPWNDVETLMGANGLDVVPQKTKNIQHDETVEIVVVDSSGGRDRSRHPAPKMKPRPRPTARNHVAQAQATDDALTTPTPSKVGDASRIKELDREKTSGAGSVTMADALHMHEVKGVRDLAQPRREPTGQSIVRMSSQKGQGDAEGFLDMLGGDERSSIFKFHPNNDGAALWDKAAYEKVCGADCAILDNRKRWFVQLGMANFFRAVPTRLNGKVDVALACSVAEGYLELELSGATEGSIDLERYKYDNEVRPAYTAALQKKTKATKTAWSKMVQPGAKRTPALLDLDVGASLAQQWARQQADARCDNLHALKRAASVGMDWGGRLPPGPNGVRLLVLTLLCWGAELDQNAASQRLEWNRLARDFADVLRVLAAQAGPYNVPAANSGTAKVAEGKRVKKVTEKAAQMQEESMNKRGGRFIQ